MKKFTVLALLLSFGLFTIGCEKSKPVAPAGDAAAPADAAAAPAAAPADAAAPAENK